MDKNTAKNACRRLKEYAKENAASGTKKQERTIDFWLDLADDLAETVEYIGKLVQASALEDTQEFENDESNDTIDHRSSVVRKMTKAKQAIVGERNPSNLPVDKMDQHPEQLAADWEVIPRNELKNIVKTYGVALEAIAHRDCGYASVNECAGLIHKWYKARIATKYNNSGKFTYCIHRIKGIIYAIVLVYSYHHERGDTSSFISEFDSWIIELGISRVSNRWIAPYEIYSVERDIMDTGVMDKRYATLTAAVIWDILLDSGLAKLCATTEQHNKYPHPDEIFERVERVNDSVLDPYVNYKDDPSITAQLKL